MSELGKVELADIKAGKGLFNKAFNIVGGALIGGVIEGIVGVAVGGPVGFAAGFAHGAYIGAASALIYEGSMSLTNTLHLKFNNHNL